MISNFGREADYERVDSPLWANLVRNKIACSHRRTGRGVEVDGRGYLLGPAGGPSGPISAVGSPREGDELVRNGRTGAFTFNLAAIKNHSVTAAATVLRHLESCYDEHAADAAAMPVTTPDQDVTAAVGTSTMLDVRRMAARRRGDRHALATRLDHSLQQIRNGMTRNGEPPRPTARCGRSSTRPATTKLTDLSVTPRDLRSMLGLA